jgi:hypothetical protein
VKDADKVNNNCEVLTESANFQYPLIFILIDSTPIRRSGGSVLSVSIIYAVWRRTSSCGIRCVQLCSVFSISAAYVESRAVGGYRIGCVTLKHSLGI